MRNTVTDQSILKSQGSHIHFHTEAMCGQHMGAAGHCRARHCAHVI